MRIFFSLVYIEYHKKFGFNLWLKDTSVVQMRRSAEALNHIVLLKDILFYHYNYSPCHLYVQSNLKHEKLKPKWNFALKFSNKTSSDFMLFRAGFAEGCLALFLELKL